MRADRRLSGFVLLSGPLLGRILLRFLSRLARWGGQETDDQHEQRRQNFIFSATGTRNFVRHIHLLKVQCEFFVCAMRIASTISRTARSSPTNAARAMMLCPMLNSSISGMRATAPTLR